MTVLLSLASRLRLAKLHLIVDARRAEGDLAEFARQMIRVGVDVLQLRDASLTPGQRVSALRTLRQATQGTRALVLSDDADAASQAGIDGVHVRRGQDTVEVKARLHPWALAGRSAHNAAELAEAITDPGTDYLLVGKTVWDSAARELPPFALPVRNKPWFAVGGITADNIDEAVRRGTRRVCVSRAITWASDPVEAAAELAGVLRRAWARDPAGDAYSMAAYSD